MCPFSDFQYGFRSYQSTADYLTVVSDRIARACNTSRATQRGLVICKAFDRVWLASLLHKFKSYGILGQIFGLIWSFLVNRCGFICFQMESLYKNFQLMLEFFKTPFLVQHFSYYALITFLMILSVILLFMLMILLCTLSVVRRQKSDLCYSVDQSRNWLVDFNAGKTQLVSFDWSNNTGAIDVRKNGSVLEEKPSFKMLGLSFFSKFEWDPYMIFIAKTGCMYLYMYFICH